MNSKSKGFSANKYYFVSIAHKKTAIFALSTLSTMFRRLRSAHNTPHNHPTSPYRPSVAGDAAAAIDLAINWAEIGHLIHQIDVVTTSPSSWKANGGMTLQQTNILNNQLVEDGEQPVRASQQQ
jgi:hypothetical protein